MNKEICGKAVIKNKVRIMTPKKGKIAFARRFIGMFKSPATW